MPQQARKTIVHIGFAIDLDTTPKNKLVGPLVNELRANGFDVSLSGYGESERKIVEDVIAADIGILLIEPIYQDAFLELLMFQQLKKPHSICLKMYGEMSGILGPYARPAYFSYKGLNDLVDHVFQLEQEFIFDQHGAKASTLNKATGVLVT